MRHFRKLCLKFAMGSSYEYMVKSIEDDPRTPDARLVDIVVRKDGMETRVEADWVKTIARLVSSDPRWG